MTISGNLFDNNLHISPVEFFIRDLALAGNSFQGPNVRVS